jgi:hypothetical protein
MARRGGSARCLWVANKIVSGKRMRKVWEKAIAFLREPAVKTAIAIISLLIGVGGTISGWFTVFFTLIGKNVPWLAESHLWPNWLAILVSSLLVVSIISNILSKVRSVKRVKSPRRRERTYHEVWNVLWGWPPTGKSYIGDGPLCPIHKLPVDVRKLDGYREGNKYEFYCPGLEGEEGHIIDGPKFSQLVGSQGTDRSDVNIYKDVNARIKAKEIAEK